MPQHQLRNGRLNQTAYSLFLFLRDIAHSDLVSWIDSRLCTVPANAARTREALLGPLRHIYGVSDKVLAMSLSMILLAAPDAKDRWRFAGGSMIAVDSLVHKFLHRTGILQRLNARHQIGSRCYGNDGCVGVVERVAKRIDAREFNRTFPSYFPRFVQYAIWRFCAQEGLDGCNSNRISDRERCLNKYCRLFRLCDGRPVIE